MLSDALMTNEMGWIKINRCIALALLCEHTQLLETRGVLGKEDAGAPGAVSIHTPTLQKNWWKTPFPHFCQQNLLQQLFAVGLMVSVSIYRQGVMMARNVSASGS